MSENILNRVAQSSLITIDLKDFYPSSSEYKIFDLADFLFEKLILKEKDFRAALKMKDFSEYKDKYVGIVCSEDVIIPQWAYLLAAISINKVCKKCFYADEKNLIQEIIRDKILSLNTDIFKDKPVIIKGCSEVEISLNNYVLFTNKLLHSAKSIMYGEPCSTVPLFKR